jgi:sugar phosphate isomerase/epimerase
MLDRRKFLKSSVVAAVSLALTPEIFSHQNGNKLGNFGFISGILDTELKGDWKKVLKEVASFGYTEFETGGFLGDSPEEFLSFCRDIALRPVAGGITFNGKDEDLAKDFEVLHKLDMPYAVTYWPWYTGGPFTLDDCKKSADRLNYIGQKCKENGIVFCWHNHDKEFIKMEQGFPFDFLMNNTDTDLVKCELDIYWVKKGGSDPLAMLKKYKGCYAILHLKDMAPGKAQDFECPGNGIIDFVPIFSEAELQGIVHFMVERDNVKDGIACLKSSAQYLKNISF